VDIQTDPAGLPATANPDLPTEIKISVPEVPETAGTWPLKGEGNLKDLRPKGSGGGGKEEWHWAAKAYKIFPILYKDNTTWTAEARLTSDPVHLFTMDVIAGVEIQTAPGKTVEAKMWTGDDTGNKVTITLTETGAGTGVYRNTGTDTWPHFYKEYQAANKRLKVVDEDKKWYVVPIVEEKEYPGLEVSEKVDAAEVAAVDGTDTLDAAAFHGDMEDDKWYAGSEDDKRLFDKNHDKADGDDGKCVELGNKVDFMYVAGHCYRGDSPTKIFGDDDTYGLKEHNDTNNLQKADIPGGKWNKELEWLVLATCSTCCIFESANPGTEWVAAMADGMHGVMGYRYGAPPVGGVTDVQLAHEFVTALGSKKIKDAWIDTNFAHKVADPSHVYSPLYAVAIFRNSNVDDQVGHLSNFPTADSTTAEYTYFYISWQATEYPPYVLLDPGPTKGSLAYNP
jgi:hypothetical protein